MLLRVMSSNTERPGEGGSSASRTAPPQNSLNSFVVNHQTPLSHAKLHRRPGLPKGKQTGSTGNLATAAQPDHRHRMSFEDRLTYESDSSLHVITRASSASQEAPQDWLEHWDRSSLLIPTSQATVPLSQALSRPLTAPSGSSAASPASSSLAGIAERPVQQGHCQQLLLEHPEQLSTAPKPAKGLVDGSNATRAEALAEETADGVPVFVMMPLDTVNADGLFRHASSRWFHQALEALVNSGVHGIAIDVWWGAVERQPGHYDWSGYRRVFELAKSMGLKIQAVLSFHACGGNVGDSAQIPLPKWVLQAGDADPDIFFRDRPRESRHGQRNREYISFWADEAPRALFGRSPMQCYTDFMRAFRTAFFDDVGDAIEEIVIGCGPCGELRYASYPETNGWRFPGVGEFQCYDSRALASLAQAAGEAGHPEWGSAGPHDCGEYNSNPEETGFFCGWGGSWDTPYGHFFLEWYAKSLLDHGERLLQAASSIFNVKSPRRRGQLQRASLSGTDNGSAGTCNSATSPSSTQQEQDAQPSPRNGASGLRSPEADSPGNRRTTLGSKDKVGGRPNVPSSAGEPSLNTSSTSLHTGQGLSNATSRASMDSSMPADPSTGQKPAFLDRGDQSDNSLLSWPHLRPTGYRIDGKSLSLASLATSDNPQTGLQSTRSEDGEHRNTRVADSPSGKPVGITLKVAGVHWWFRTRAHAAELTAGYFNAGGRDGYRDIIELCAKYNAGFTLTCVEMCDAQHPPEALCGPEGLLRQVKEAAAEAGVEMGGENALPCFSPQYIDAAGLDRIVYNTQAWAPPLQEEAAKEEALYNRHSDPNAVDTAVPPLPDAVKLGFLKDPRFVRSGKLLQSRLPTMRGLTFLRLTPEMMTPSYQDLWLRFMHRMRNVGKQPKHLPRTPLQADGPPSVE